LPRITSKFVLLLLMTSFASYVGTAQSGIQAAPSEISQVKVLRERDSLAVEITSTHQVIPTITGLGGQKPRLIIDLPNAQLSVRRKRTGIHSDDIGAVRLVQYSMSPPVVQVIVDLVRPRAYTWEAAGNRLIVRLQSEQQGRQREEVTSEGSSIAFTKSVEQTAAPASLVNSSHVVFLDSLASGGSVSGGADPAVLRLSRGEVHVCPGTTVSVMQSQGGPEMMLAVSTGALETHYALGDSTDSILTPDFRILLHGPGEFHYAIKVDSQGNACIRTMPRNTGSVTVSELIGNGERQMGPADQLVFHSGRFADVDSASADTCGCSALELPMMRTFLPSPPDNAPLPALSPGDVHVQVDVPLVFPDRIWPENKLMAIEDSRNQPRLDNVAPASAPAGAVTLTPQATTQSRPPRAGFLGRIKGFITGMFR